MSELRNERVLEFFFFFSSRRRHTRLQGDWGSDVCSSDLETPSGSGIMPANSRSGSAPSATAHGRSRSRRSAAAWWNAPPRSEERRVGKEWRARGAREGGSGRRTSGTWRGVEVSWLQK